MLKRFIPLFGKKYRGAKAILTVVVGAGFADAAAVPKDGTGGGGFLVDFENHAGVAAIFIRIV